MNVLHFSSSDIQGGAAKAAYRLHAALRQAGHGSQMVVLDKLSDDVDVIALARRRRLVLSYKVIARFVTGKSWRKVREFNTDLTPVARLDALFGTAHGFKKIDLIYLHWISGLLSTKNIAALARHFDCPVVWVMQDLEPLTGGCHYPGSCEGFTGQCGSCPQLASGKVKDRSSLVWQRKRSQLAPLPMTLVSGSSWLTTQARKSSLWRHTALAEIGDPIDVTVFRPFDQQMARQLLHLPAQARVLFLGAFSLTDPRKGMRHLLDALHQLHEKYSGEDAGNRQPIHLLVAGNRTAAFCDALPFPYTAVGFLRDEITLALAYQAADVFLCPSLEDAGPMMIPEAMLCGTPVVAFHAGIAQDLIPASQTGYLARMGDSADFARGIAAVLDAPDREQVRQRAHDTAFNRHAPAIVAEQHLRLYQSLTSGAPMPGSRSGRDPEVK